MFLKIFPSLKENKFINFINKALASPFYIAFVAVMLTMSAIFNVGFLFYYILICTSIVLPCLLGEDMIGIVPLAIMLNIGISKQLKEQNEMIFLGKNVIHFVFVLLLVILFGFGRLIFDLIKEKERRKRFPRLLIGYLTIFIAFLAGGFLFPDHSYKDVIFGLREFLAIGGFYFYFFYTIDFTKMKKSYFAYLLFFFALSVSSQILVEAIRTGLEQSLLVGWGNRSGLGGTLVACFTGTAYLIIKKKAYISWLFALFYVFFLTMICMTQCRGAAFTAIVISIPCFVLTLVFSDKMTRVSVILVVIVYAITMGLMALFDNPLFTKCFGRLFNFDFDTIDDYSTGRIGIWKTGFDQFIHYPIFGVGWYQIPGLGFPARYHNTAIQVLASTGIVGAIAYLYHRFETVFVTFKKPTLEKSFAFIAILCILVSSLLDCFLFNIWLGFTYSFLLAFIEGRNRVIKMEEEITPPKYQVYQTGGTSIVIINR